MVFEGSVFFLSQKLTIPLTSKLIKLIIAKGGAIAKDVKDPNTIIVIETWDPESELKDPKTGKIERIVGSSVVEYCADHDEPFPADDLPLLCFALRGHNVAITGYTEERKEKLERMVQWCGGSVTSYVDESTTVVVTDVANGPKIDAARRLGVRVVRKDWIEHTFKAQAVAEFVPIKPLQGAVIVLSGFPPEDYPKWETQLAALGAGFAKSMTPSTTHLIIDVSRTGTGPRSKYHQAKLNHIRTVTKFWFQACRANRVWAPEQEFEVASPDDPHPTASAVPRIPPRSPNASPIRTRYENDTYNYEPELTYLENCNIYLHALAGAVGPLQAIIRSAKGSETQDASSATHIVASLDDGTALLTSALVSMLESSSNRPLLVSHSWLEHCNNTRSLVDVSPFSLQYDAATRLASLSISPAAGQASTANPKKRARETESARESDSEEVIMQMEIQEPIAKRPTPAPAQMIPTVAHPHLFDGLHFISAFPHDNKLEELIVSHGGSYWLLGRGSPPLQSHVYFVLPHGYSCQPFRLVVESTRQRYPNSEIVSIQWLEHCRDYGTVESVDLCRALFVPLQFPLEQYHAAMGKFVLCIASIKSMEHSFVKLLGNLLGCKTSDSFLRKQTTHVISLTPTGKKQDLALQIGIHLVKPEWLYCCALQGCAVLETSYRLVPLPPIAEPSAMSSQHLAQPMVMPSQVPSFANSAYNPGFIFPPSFVPNSSDSLLKGVVVYIGRLKSADESREMKSLAGDLGAEVAWSFDTNVTHVVTDNKQDLPAAQPATFVAGSRGKPVPTSLYASEPKSHKPFYVSPAWLRECSLQLIRVDEALYPAILNPMSALNIESGPNVHHSTLKTVNPFFSSPHDFDPDYSTEPKKALLISQHGPPSQTARTSKSSASASSASTSTQSKRMTSVFVPKNSATAEFESFEDIDSHYNRPKTNASSSSMEQLPRASMAPSASQEPLTAQSQYVSNKQHTVPQQQPIQRQPSFNDASSSSVPSLPLETPVKTAVSPPKASVDVIRAPTPPPQLIAVAPVAVPSPAPQAPLPIDLETEGKPSAQSQEEEALLQQLAPSSQLAPLPPIAHAYSAQIARSTTKSPQKPADVAPIPEEVATLTSNLMQVDEPAVVSAPVSAAPSVPPSVEMEPVMLLTSEPPSLEMQAPIEIIPHKSSQMDVDTSLEVAEEPESTSIGIHATSQLYGTSQQASLPTLNQSVLESQDVALSQPPDPKAAEKCLAQTEKMRELLVLAQKALRQNPRPVRDSAPASEQLSSYLLGAGRPRAPSPVGGAPGGPANPNNGSRHIARAELLNFDPHRTKLDRSDSSHSLSSGRSEHASSDTLPDGEEPALLNASPHADYLEDADFDAEQAPRVSYGSLEPSDAVKEKMLDRAETHDNTSQFELDAKKELDQMAQWAKASSDSGSTSNLGITLDKTSTSSIGPKRTLPGSDTTLLSMVPSDALSLRKTGRTLSVTSLASEDPKQSPASDTTAVVSSPHPLPPKDNATKPGVRATKISSTKSATVSTKLIDLDADDEDCLAALDPAPARPKPKLSTTTWPSAKKTTLEPPPVTKAPASPTSNIFSKARRVANPSALVVSNSSFQGSDIYLHVSGHKRAERESILEQMAQKFGVKTPSASGPWTHFVVSLDFKTTDKYLISIVNGCWVVTMDWVTTALSTGQLPNEEDYEFVPSEKQLASGVAAPKPCRLAAQRDKKTIFERLRIIHVGAETDIWARIFKQSRCFLRVQSADGLKTMPVDDIKSCDILHIDYESWNSLPARTKSLLSQLHVVVTEFFIHFLREGKYPDPFSYHPTARLH